MNTFNYDGPVIKFLETIANMIIVSICWLVCCVGIVTIVPASAALYHTIVKVVFGAKNGKGVLKDFFTTFKSSFKQGWILSLVTLAACFFTFEGIYTGAQIYKWGVWGVAYMALGIIILLVVFPAIFYIPPVLSRFEADNVTILRMALFFSSGSILLNLEYMFLLVFMYLAVGFFPLFLLLVPAVFVDLVRPQTEKKMMAFMIANNLQEASDDEEEIIEEEEDFSLVDLNNKLTDKKKKGK